MTFPQLIGACIVVALAMYGMLALSTIIYRRARNALDRRHFIRRRVTLEQVAEFAERDCKNCLATGVLNRRTGVGKNAASYPIPCSCASRAFMKVHEGDTRMLGQFRLWKRGRGPRRGPIARSEARRAVA